MSVSKTTKCEIIKKNIFKNEKRALAQGIVLSAGNLLISNGKLSFVISNECEELITFFKQIMTSLYENLEFDEAQVVKNFKNKERYEVSIVGENNFKVLESLGVVKNSAEGLEICELCDKGFMKNNNSMLAFLTGMFLGSGSLSVPNDKSLSQKSYGYHFEISVSMHKQAELVSEILSNFDIFPKIVERNDSFVVYLKNSEVICDTLSLMGASKVVLELMNQKVSRDVKNNTNRQINCISANIDKAVNAGIKQLKAIEIIQNTIGIENLPDVLAEAALSRLANPEGSLSDLLQTLSSKVTKGALAQRFNKIIKIAEELGDANED